MHFSTFYTFRQTAKEKRLIFDKLERLELYDPVVPSIHQEEPVPDTAVQNLMNDQKTDIMKKFVNLEDIHEEHF